MKNHKHNRVQDFIWTELAPVVAAILIILFMLYSNSSAGLAFAGFVRVSSFRLPNWNPEDDDDDDDENEWDEDDLPEYLDDDDD